MAEIDIVASERKRKAVACLGFLLLCEKEDGKAKRGKTREWIPRRSEGFFFNNIVQELRIEDTQGYKETMRMKYQQLKFAVDDQAYRQL